MSPNFNSMFYDSVVSSPTEPQLTSPDGSIDPKGGLSYISVYSTVMVFNPDFNPDFNPNFNFGNIIKRSSTGPINGNFTSWFESDGESSPARNTPLAKIEEITLSPKSNPKSIITCDLEGSPAYPNKVYSESNGSRIGISPTWLKPNRKVNPKKQSPPQIGATVPANGESSQRLDRRCMLERSDAQYNSILLSESQDEDQTGSCRSREASDGGLGDRGTGYQKLILDSSSTVYSASNNSSSSTIRPIEAPATVAAVPIAEEPSNKNLRIFRPKLQLRTAISNSTFRSTPILIAPPASRERRNSKEKGLTQSKGPRATSSHSAVSRASSPERDTTETPQESRTKLPLSALLLSPLGAVARNRSKSTSRGRFSIALSLSNGNNNNNTTTTTKSNSTARPSSASGGPSQEIDEADEEVAELSDIVSHRQVVGSAKEQQPSGSSRSVSRFRRFSLAYLSGSEHDYDGGSEQSSRSPLRSWKSWSNRSSIASFSSLFSCRTSLETSAATNVRAPDVVWKEFSGHTHCDPPLANTHTNIYCY
ncbi:uncharacterized protein DFL_008828 [Arthrobotrys flagrans]|uniref:Uncharacterized protein n=1 Tax=Arthrobotrys flagrans TaxID=97331 RepID=A0A436ZPY2_ARTFL|nr:hypothetical protein DFL_008828 [Arthrobotrys flagrans]